MHYFDYLDVFSFYLPHRMSHAIPPPPPISRPWRQDVVNRYENICEAALEASKKETLVYNKHWIDSPWSGFFEVSSLSLSQKKKKTFVQMSL